MNLAVIIVHFKSARMTQRCLASVREAVSRGGEISLFAAIVDNDPDNPFPGDGSEAVVIRTGENKGFASAVNIGFKKMPVHTDYYLILNNDVQLLPNTFEQFALSARHHPEKIIGPMILEEISGKPAKKGGNVNRFTMYFKEEFPLAHQALPTDFLTGAALFISRDAFLKIGEFDERFFMYGEDLDYCLRAKDQNVGMIYDPSIQVCHKGGAASGGLSPFTIYYIHRNRVLLAKKRHTPVYYVLFTGVYSLIIVAKIVKWIWKNSALTRWFFKGYSDGLKGRTGRADIVF